MAQEENKQQETRLEDYTYQAPTPCHFNEGEAEYSLHQGFVYTLPSTEFVEALVAQGKLTKNV